ncbi:MAG: TylF/MycF/NovP-related O-methyltransferase [Actinomycetota bacterium]
MSEATRRDPFGSAVPLRDRYIELVKRAVTHLLYRPIDVWADENAYGDSEELREAVLREWADPDFDPANVRIEGRDYPLFGQTMVGLQRVENVQFCVESVLAEGVPGDLIETGVWRGGVTILMRAILEAWDDRSRSVWVADSFAGLPAPDAAFPADSGSLFYTLDSLAISREEVARNFDLYGLLDDQVVFVEGWFKDTLPSLRDRTWSVLRLDGDMYESTYEVLENLYPGLSPGGYCIVDDYKFEPCRQAVNDYREAHGIAEPIEMIDWLGAFWRRAQ